MTEEELQQILGGYNNSNSAVDTGTSDVDEILRQQAAKATSPLRGSLVSQGNNLQELQAAKDAINSPALVGSPQSKDFQLVGEPVGGSVATIPPAEQPFSPIPESNALVPSVSAKAGGPSWISQLGSLIPPIEEKGVAGTLGAAAKGISPAAVALGVADPTSTANPKDFLGQEIPGRPGALAKGPDIEVPLTDDERLKKIRSDLENQPSALEQIKRKILPAGLGELLPALGKKDPVELDQKALEVLADQKKEESKAASELKEKQLAAQAIVDKFTKLGLTPSPAVLALANSGKKEEKPGEEVDLDNSGQGPLANRSPFGPADLARIASTSAPSQSQSAVRSVASAPTSPVDAAGALAASLSKAAPPSQNPQDMLKSIYGSSMGDAALLAAQDQRNRMLQQAGISRGVEQAIAGISKGTHKADFGSQEALEKQALLPVEDILTRRKAAEQGLDTRLKLSDIMDKEQRRDPRSAVSKAYRDFVVSIGLGGSINPSMSAEAIKDLLPAVDVKLKSDANKLERQRQYETKQELVHNKAETDLGTKTEQLYSPRGPAGRAAIMVQAADRLLDTVNSYPDPNKVPPEVMQMLGKDLGTIYNGGTSTEGSSKRIMPPSVSSDWARVKEAITSRPQGSGMGPWAQEMKRLASELKKGAQAYEYEHASNLIDSYRSSLRPDYYNDLKQKLKNKYAQAEPSQTNAPKAGDIVKGYRFKGGDPRKQENWEKP